MTKNMWTRMLKAPTKPVFPLLDNTTRSKWHSTLQAKADAYSAWVRGGRVGPDPNFKGADTGGKIKLLAKIPSKTKRGVFYEVTAEQSGNVTVIHCNCPGFTFNGKCWHTTKFQPVRKS